MRKIFCQKNLNIVSYCALTLIFFFYYYFLVCDLKNLSGNFFSERDYVRAIFWLEKNILISGGSELSGGGSSAGPFLYLLIALPLSINMKIESVMFFLSLINTIALLHLYYYFRLKIGSICAFIFSTFLMLSPVILSNICQMWNPGFLMPFLIESMIFFSFFDNKNKYNKLSLIFSGVFIGLALQIHSSVAFVIIGYIFYLLFQKNRSKNIIYIFSGIILGILPFHLLATPGNYENAFQLKEYFVLSFEYLINSGTHAYQSIFVFQLKDLIKAALYTFLIVFNPVVLFFYFIFSPNSISLGQSIKNKFLPALILSSLGVIYYFLADSSTSRYTICFVVLLPFYILECSNKNFESKKRILKIIILIFFFGIAPFLYSFNLNIISNLIYKNFPNGRGILNTGYFLNIEDHKNIKNVFLKNGMNWTENVRQKIYFVDITRASFIPMMVGHSEAMPFTKKEATEGFIIASSSIKDINEYLPKIIRDEILVSKILLNLELETKSIKIFHYSVTIDSSFPYGFSNAGYAYNSTMQGDSLGTEKLFSQVFDFSSAQPFKANICEFETDIECPFGAYVWEKKSANGTEFQILMDSKMANSNSIWTPRKPGIYLFLDASLVFDCGGIELEKSIGEYVGPKTGFKSKNSKYNAYMHSMGLPIIRKFYISCPTTVRLISIKASDLELRYKNKILNQNKINAKFYEDNTLEF